MKKKLISLGIIMNVMMASTCLAQVYGGGPLQANPEQINIGVGELQECTVKSETIRCGDTHDCKMKANGDLIMKSHFESGDTGRIVLRGFAIADLGFQDKNDFYVEAETEIVVTAGGKLYNKNQYAVAVENLDGLSRLHIIDVGDLPDGIIDVGDLPDGIIDVGDLPDGIIDVGDLPDGFAIHNIIDVGDLPDGIIDVGDLPCEIYNPDTDGFM